MRPRINGAGAAGGMAFAPSEVMRREPSTDTSSSKVGIEPLFGSVDLAWAAAVVSDGVTSRKAAVE
jgi:hypothetical protein